MLGWLFFSDLPGAAMLAEATIIAASGLVIVLHETRQVRRMPARKPGA